MKPSRCARRPAFAAALVLCAGPAAAQTATLDPVFVTATRTPQPMGDVLSDVRLIERTTIERSGALTLAELLQAHAGIEVATSGGAGQTSSVFVRGSNFNHVVVLVDGVRVASATTGANAFEHIPLKQIERIEVLRGPASSLYGADAIGGAIQIFTRQGERTTARAAIGSRHTGELSAGFGRHLGDVAQLSLQAGLRESRSFSATRPSSFSFDADADGYRNRNLGGSLAAEWAPGHRVSARALFSDGNAQFDCGAGNDDRNRQKLGSVALESRDRFGADWHSTLRLARGSDHSASSGGFCASRFDTDADQFGWQHDVAAAGGRLAAGLEWRRERVDGSTAFVVDRRDIRSLYASYAAERQPQSLQLSLRHDDNSQFGAHTSGNVAWGWRFAPAWRVAAGAGSAFNAPSFNDLYIPLTDFGSPGFAFLYAGNPELRPERARSAELGLRYDGGALRGGLVAFRNRIRDLIANGTLGTAPPINTVLNVNRARIRGATLDLALERAAFSLRGEVTAQQATDEATGARLPRRARRFGSAGIAVAPGGWRAGADVVFSGERFDTIANAPASRMGGYARVDLHAARALTPELRLSAQLVNAGDKRYEQVQGFNTPPRGVFVALDFVAR